MDRLIIPTTAHTLDCFNTASSLYSNGSSLFTLQPSTTLDPLFIAGLFGYIYNTNAPYDSPDFIISTEGLRDYLGFSRGGRSKDIRQELTKLDTQTCYIDNIARPLTMVSFEGRLTHIHSDYFHELAVAMKEYAKKPDGSEGSRYTSLVKSSIVNTRSKSSSEVCIELCKVIERRGLQTTGSQVHISISTLLQRCPSLRRGIEEAPTNSRRNQILQYAIITGIRLLSEKTSIYEEYKSLQVIAPDAISLLSTKSVILAVHEGKIILK